MKEIEVNINYSKMDNYIAYFYVNILNLCSIIHRHQSGPWVDGSWVMGQMGHVNRWVTAP